MLRKAKLVFRRRLVLDHTLIAFCYVFLLRYSAFGKPVY
jgi:hypothetical protein